MLEQAMKVEIIWIDNGERSTRHLFSKNLFYEAVCSHNSGPKCRASESQVEQSHYVPLFLNLCSLLLDVELIGLRWGFVLLWFADKFFHDIRRSKSIWVHGNLGNARLGSLARGSVVVCIVPDFCRPLALSTDGSAINSINIIFDLLGIPSPFEEKMLYPPREVNIFLALATMAS